MRENTAYMTISGVDKNVTIRSVDCNSNNNNNNNNKKNNNKNKIKIKNKKKEQQGEEQAQKCDKKMCCRMDIQAAV